MGAAAGVDTATGVDAAAGGLDLVVGVWKTVHKVGSGSLQKGQRLEKGPGLLFCLETLQSMVSAL